MKAVRCCDNHVQLTNVPEPSGDGIKVRVRSAGICSSDLHMIDLGFAPQVTLGHEIAGELPDGTPVAIEPLAACGHCDMCVDGRYEMCRTGAATLHGVGQDGGMAEYVLVPERCIVPLPNNVRAQDACLVEPLAVAAHGIRSIDLAPKQRAAIVGAGSVGLAATALLTGNISVTVAARHDAQKRVAEQLGAKLDPSGEYDIVFDCAGNNESLAQAASLCKPGGAIVLLATYWRGVELPAMEVCFKNLRIYASSMYGKRNLVRDVDVAAHLLAAKPELAQLLITHRLPLDSAPEAFDIARNRQHGAIKVVLEP